MKYLLILLAVAGFLFWWWERRRAVIRERLRREAAKGPALLERCPRCGVYAVKDGHTCG